MTEKKWRTRVLGNRLLSPETLMMGYGYDPGLSEQSLKPPVFRTSTFVFRSAQDGKDFFELAYGLRQKRPQEEPGLIYSRINNPDLEMLEDRLAIWDAAENSLVFASGMAAISTTLWAIVRPGDVLLHSDPVYGGADFLLNKILPQFGVTPVGFAAEGGACPWPRPRNRRRPPAPSPRSMSRRPPTRPMAWSTSQRFGVWPTRLAKPRVVRWSSSTIRCSARCFRLPSSSAPISSSPP